MEYVSALLLACATSGMFWYHLNSMDTQKIHAKSFPNIFSLHILCKNLIIQPANTQKQNYFHETQLSFPICITNISQEEGQGWLVCHRFLFHILQIAILRITMVDPCCNMITQYSLAKVLIEKLACNSGFNGDLWTCHDPKWYKLNFQSSSSGSIMYIHLKPAAPERTNQYYESINFQKIHPLLNLL